MPVFHVQPKCRHLLFVCVAWVLTDHALGQVGTSPEEKVSRRTHRSAKQLVEQLSHDRYHTRASATRELIERAISGDHSEQENVTASLEQGLHAHSFETREACQRILDEISIARCDQQLKRLLNPRCRPDSIKISGWELFCGIAGDDIDARKFFARLVEHHPDTLNQLQRIRDLDPTESLFANLDPWRIHAENSAAWALLLLAESERCKYKSLPFNSRLGTALSCSPMGPAVSRCSESRVLRRLIAHWIQMHEQRHAQRDRLLIAMRYGCHDAAAEICARILDDRSATPATEVTALLAAAALRRNDLELQTRLRLHDSRTAHVWQQVTSRKVKIRTQVKDVALAVLLYHHGLDPRQAGYRDLQADPSFVYRDHSLGFPNPDARLAAQKEAVNLLAATGVTDLGSSRDLATAPRASDVGGDYPVELVPAERSGQ